MLLDMLGFAENFILFLQFSFLTSADLQPSSWLFHWITSESKLHALEAGIIDFTYSEKYLILLKFSETNKDVRILYLLKPSLKNAANQFYGNATELKGCCLLTKWFSMNLGIFKVNGIAVLCSSYTLSLFNCTFRMTAHCTLVNFYI